MPNLRLARKARKVSEETPDRESLRQMQQMDADTGWLYKCIEELLSMGTRRFQLSGSGEPFLHKDLMKIITHLKGHGSYCVVFTNGTLLNHDRIDELIRLKLDELRITPMAASSEMYACTHPGTPKETFEILEENLRYFTSRKLSTGIKRPRIILIFVIIKQNAAEIADFARFASSVGAESIQYQPITYLGDEKLISLALEEEQIAMVKEQLMEARSFLELNNIDHNIDSFGKAFSGQLNTSSIYRQIPCYMGNLNISLDLDGSVYPCFGGKVSFGNTLDKSLKEIWYSNDYRRFREQALTLNRRKGLIEGCDCNLCVNHVVNLRVYKKLYPIKGLSSQIRNLTPIK
jgi:radical SAM protein with 4Fe4S-binding SPASM domain